MKYLFLEGDSGCGKTTLIQEVLQEQQVEVVGFTVQRIEDKQGKTKAFELKAATGKQEIDEGTQKNHWFIEKRTNDRITRHLSVFENYGNQLLKEAKNSCETILLDEIGGVELLVPSFVENLLHLFTTEKKILGVFKSEKNFQNQKRHSQNELSIEKEREEIKSAFLKNGVLLELTKENREEIKQKIVQFLMN